MYYISERSERHIKQHPNGCCFAFLIVANIQNVKNLHIKNMGLDRDFILKHVFDVPLCLKTLQKCLKPYFIGVRMWDKSYGNLVPLCSFVP